jgi:hypothetical protein
LLKKNAVFHGLLSLLNRANTIASPTSGSTTRFIVTCSAVDVLGAVDGVAVRIAAASPRHTVVGKLLPTIRPGRGGLERGEASAITVERARTRDTSRSSSLSGS